MSTGLGILSKLAFRIEGGSTSGRGMANTAYPRYPATTSPHADEEEVALGGSDLVPFLSEAVEEEYNHEPDETLIGGAGTPGMDLVGILPGGSIEISAHYDGLDALIACAMGFEKPVAADSPTYDSGTALTASACGAGNFINNAGVFTSADVGKFIRITSGTEQGQVRRISAYVGTTQVSITPNWDVTPGGGETAEMSKEFTHTFEFSNSLCTEEFDDVYSAFPVAGIYNAGDKIVRRGTLGIEKNQTKPWVYRSVMVNSMTISGQAGAGIQFSFDMVPFDLDRDSATNTSSSSWDWDHSSTLFEENEKIVFSDMTFCRVDSYSTGTALTSADNMGINGFTITLNNSLQGDDQSALTGLYRVEPARGGMREVTGTFTVPRYEADTWKDWKANETKLMGHIQFEGSTMDSETRQLNLYLNTFEITKVGIPVAGAGVMTQNIEFRCLVPTGQPASFPTHTLTSPRSEFTITTRNQNPFNVFLDQNQEY